MRHATRRPGAAKVLEVAARRARTRRAIALVGMFGAIGGLVGLRGTLSAPPTLAVNSSGLAAPVGVPTAASSAKRPQHHAPIASLSPRSRGLPAHQVIVGSAFDVNYGIVQVKVTWTGTRITDVQTLSLPQGGRSSDISRNAAPQLLRETLTAQSARIDTVSGASYTSAGYARSVQSAIDKRGK